MIPSSVAAATTASSNGSASAPAVSSSRIRKTLHPHPEFLIPATNEIIQEFADLLAVVAKAVADDQITREEAADIRGRWEELKSVTEGFVCACEEGDFIDLKKKHAAAHKARADAADSDAEKRPRL